MDGGIWERVGDGSWVGHRSSNLFPTYTRGNAGEVYPEVFRPLSFSLSAAAGEEAMRNAMRMTGLVTDAELDAAPLTALGSGVFGGYAYLNLSIQRLIAHRMPGATIDDVDEGYFGRTSPRPPVMPSEQMGNLRCSIRGLRYLIATLRTKELPVLARHQRLVDDLLRRLPPLDSSDEDLAHAVDDVQDLFGELYETHLVVSGQAGLAVGGLRGLCERFVGDADLALDLLAGIGDIDSAAPSLALWDLSRTVAADTHLTHQFDQGIDGLHERLAADPRTSDFAGAFGAFLAEHGCRGPNEWDTAFDTWETKPELALVLVDRMRTADPDHDPAQRRVVLVHRREAAEARLMREAGRIGRRLVRPVLAAARLFSQSRERSKTTVVRAIHGMRQRGKELDRRLVGRGGGQPGDLWFIVMDELDDYIADPRQFGPVIGERRRVHSILAEREPPFVFVHTQPAVETWPRRDLDVPLLQPGDELQGIAGCPGVARGRARVVTDPADPGEFAAGDVLVAPHTDPSWTPLFVPAEAVVVDVGAVLSHAVIVSRELGIPCVVSAEDASRRIPDGAVVEVDGGAGTVTIVEESPS